MAELVVAGRAQVDRHTVQRAVLDAGVGGVEVEIGQTVVVHLHQQAAQFQVVDGVVYTQVGLGTGCQNHLPVGRGHAAAVDHRGRDQHHAALAAGGDVGAFEHLDEAARLPTAQRTLKLRRCQVAEQAVGDEAVGHVQRAGGEAVQVHLRAAHEGNAVAVDQNHVRLLARALADAAGNDAGVGVPDAVQAGEAGAGHQLVVAQVVDLAELHAGPGADVEPLPVQDRPVAHLVDERLLAVDLVARLAEAGEIGLRDRQFGPHGRRQQQATQQRGGGAARAARGRFAAPARAFGHGHQGPQAAVEDKAVVQTVHGFLRRQRAGGHHQS